MFLSIIFLLTIITANFSFYIIYLFVLDSEPDAPQDIGIWGEDTGIKEIVLIKLIIFNLLLILYLNF